MLIKLEDIELGKQALELKLAKIILETREINRKIRGVEKIKTYLSPKLYEHLVSSYSQKISSLEQNQEIYKKRLDQINND